MAGVATALLQSSQVHVLACSAVKNTPSQKPCIHFSALLCTEEQQRFNGIAHGKHNCFLCSLVQTASAVSQSCDSFQAAVFVAAIQAKPNWATHPHLIHPLHPRRSASTARRERRRLRHGEGEGREQRGGVASAHITGMPLSKVLCAMLLLAAGM